MSDHPQDTIKPPPADSVWIHRNGTPYTVLMVANQPGRPDEYPITVVYQGPNGKIWARPLTRWYQSMTQIVDF